MNRNQFKYKYNSIIKYTHTQTQVSPESTHRRTQRKNPPATNTHTHKEKIRRPPTHTNTKKKSAGHQHTHTQRKNPPATNTHKHKERRGQTPANTQKIKNKTAAAPSRITANTRLIGAASAWCGGASSTCRKQAY